MLRTSLQSRRSFLARSLGVLGAMGAGVLVGDSLFADKIRLASRMNETPKSHPLAPALRMGMEALDAMDPVKDYTATLLKRELLNGKMLDTKIQIKFRESPFSVYLKFLQPNAGREVVYVQGQNDGKLLVHETGIAALAGTLALDPAGSLALSENRHPITSIGMKNLAAKMMEQWLDETAIEGMSVGYFPNARIEEISCKAIETKHPVRQKGTKFHISRLYLDAQTKYPIRVQQFDFPAAAGGEPPLVEDYLYSNLAMNVGLADLDFSTKNPNYGF